MTSPKIPVNGNIDDIVEPLVESLALSVGVLVGLPGGAPVLLSEEPHQELPLLAPVEGGGDDGVLPGGQHQPLAHLPQVHVLVSLAYGVVPTCEMGIHFSIRV